jgi:hypothetical protein
MKKIFWGGLFSILLMISTMVMSIYNLTNFEFNNKPIVLTAEEFIGKKKG